MVPPMVTIDNFLVRKMTKLMGVRSEKNLRKCRSLHCTASTMAVNNGGKIRQDFNSTIINS
jgi:hypothetical protein